VEKRACRAIERKLRNAWIATRTLHDFNAPPHTSFKHIRLDDSESQHKDDWARHFRSHCLSIYSSGDDAVDSSLLSKLRIHAARALSDRQDGFPKHVGWSLRHLLLAKSRLSKGKSPGASALCPEMIQALSASALLVLNAALRDYFFGVAPRPLGWNRIMIVLLSKVTVPRSLNDFRGISLLNCCSKLYMAGVVQQMQAWVSKTWGARWRRALVFGFEPGCSCEQLAVAAQLLMFKAAEWPAKASMAMLASDVRRAFDCLTLPVLLDCLQYWSFPSTLICAFFRELLDNTAEASLAQICSSGAFPFNKCLRQGSCEGPWCWNLLCRTILDKLWHKWCSKGICLPLLGPVQVLFWADNVYFLSTGAEDTISLWQEFSHELYALGLEWKTGSLQMIASDIATGTPLTVNFADKEFIISVDQHLPVLGCLLSKDFKESVAHGLRKGTAAFWKGADFFRCKEIPLQQRLHQFRKRVLPICLYGSAAWVWCRHTCAAVTSWENGLLRLMFKVARRPLEPFESWRVRHTRIVRSAYHEGHQPSACTLLLHRQFSLATNAIMSVAVDALERTPLHTWPLPPAWDAVFQRVRYDPRARALSPAHCFLGCALHHYDEWSWKLTQSAGLLADAKNASSWRHTRPGRHLNWERALVAAFGINWKLLVLQDAWMSRKGAFCNASYSLIRTRPWEDRASASAPAALQPLGCSASANVPPSVTVRVPMPWASLHTGVAFEALCDSLLVVNWVNGSWPVHNRRLLPTVARIMDRIQAMSDARISPRGPCAMWLRHIPRTLNAAADAAAACQVEDTIRVCKCDLGKPWMYLRGASDGSKSPRGSACGWVLWASVHSNDTSPDDWRKVAWAHFNLPGSLSVVETELMGTMGLLTFIHHWVLGTILLQEASINYDTSGMLEKGETGFKDATLHTIQICKPVIHGHVPHHPVP